jgi:hypothetical protein
VADFIAWGAAALLVLITVSIHYEAMLTVSDHFIPWAQRHFHGRRVIAFAIAALMMGHIIEIWLWAAAYAVMAHANGFGTFKGTFDHGFHSYLYMSAVNYTSLGDNGIRPEGAVRTLVATETLVGMLMIAWSASFTYLKMEQIWKGHGRHE